MKRGLMIAAACLTLAACSKVEMDRSAPPAAGAESAGPGQEPLAGVPSLAYRYRYGLEAPSDKLRSLAQMHETACADAGPAVCQILGQSMKTVGRNKLQGELSLRATPLWLKGFRERLGEHAKAVGGEVATSGVETDDLTRPIIDAEARLQAKVAARDRLRSLVSSKAGSREELQQMVADLDAAQTEVEAIRANLSAMSAQVAMQELHISYLSSGMMAPDGTWSPVASALNDSVGGLAFTLALLIRGVTVLGPLGLVLGAGVLLTRRFRRPAAPAQTTA